MIQQKINNPTFPLRFLLALPPPGLALLSPPPPGLALPLLPRPGLALTSPSPGLALPSPPPGLAPHYRNLCDDLSVVSADIIKCGGASES